MSNIKELLEIKDYRTVESLLEGKVSNFKELQYYYDALIGQLKLKKANKVLKEWQEKLTSPREWGLWYLMYGRIFFLQDDNESAINAFNLGKDRVQSVNDCQDILQSLDRFKERATQTKKKYL